MQAAGRPKIQIFISSPSDVRQERLLARQVIERLAREFATWIDLDPVLWEREPLVATEHFQTMIVPPSSTDIVVCILWSRLGTPLPADQFAGRITRRPVTGTEWEFEDAVASWRERRAPELLLYRKQAAVTAIISDRRAREDAVRQLDMLEAFVERWFLDPRDSSFKAASHTFRGADEFVELLETHLRELLRRRLPDGSAAEAEAPVRWHRGSPFRGLESFEVEHAPVYFGRLKARTQLREALVRQIAAGTGFVVAMGMSGVGKSSLVKAGLLADLCLPGMIDRVGLVRHAVLRPGADPLATLAAAIIAACREIAMDPPALATLLRHAPAQAAELVRTALATAAAGAQLAPAAQARLALVVDQLEELFAAPPEQDRRAFAGALAALARSGVAWIVATMRSDRYHHLAEIGELAALAAGDGTYLLLPPRPEEIGQIIRQPAREAGLGFEIAADTGIGLDAVLLEAAGRDVGALPLLEFVLHELWQQRAGQRLTYAAYRRLGGLAGALAQRAETTLSALAPEVQSAFPAVMRSLVTVDAADERTPAGQAAPLAELSPAARAFVDAFVQARLLVADLSGGVAVVRVAHEALLAHWPRVTRWLEESRASLRGLARVARAAARWREEAEHPDFLLPDGRPLAEALAMLEELPAELATFVTASNAHRTEQRGAVERAREEARQSGREILAGRLARKAEETPNPVDRLLLAIEAYRAFPGAAPGARLRRLLRRAPRPGALLGRFAAIAPDGSSGIVLDRSAARRILLPSGEAAGAVHGGIRAVACTIRDLPKPEGLVDRLRHLFAEHAPDRSTTETVEWQGVGALSADGTRAMLTTQVPHGGRAFVDFDRRSAWLLPMPHYRFEASLSPQGSLVLLAHEPHGIEARDVHSGDRLWFVPGMIGKAVVSPDDRLAAVAFYTPDPRTILILDARTGRRVDAIALPASGAEPLVFSPDASRLMVRATQGSSCSALLLDVRSRSVLAQQPDHFAGSASPLEAAQGLLLAWAGTPAVLRVTDMLRNTTRELVPGYPGRYIGSQLGPDGLVALTVEEETPLGERRPHTEVFSAHPGEDAFDLEAAPQHFHPTEPIAFAASGDEFRAWHLQRLDSDLVGRSLELESAATAVSASLDGGLAAVSYHNNLQMDFFWPIGADFIPPSYRELVAAMQPSVRNNDIGLFDLVHGREIWRVRCEHEEAPPRMLFDPAGRQLAIALHGTIEVRRVLDGSIAAKLESVGKARAMAYDATGALLALADDRSLAVHDAASLAMADWRVAECGGVTSLAFDAEGKWLAAATDEGWRAWSRDGTAQGDALLDARIQRLAGGELVAVGRRGDTAVVVDLPSGRVRASVEARRERRPSAALSLDGRILAVREGTELRIVDCRNMDVRARLEGAQGWLSFGADPRWLHEDGGARVWDLEAGCLGFESDRNQGVTARHVMPHGRSVLWWSGTRLSWLGFGPEALIELAATRITRPMSEPLWAELMPTRPYDPIRPAQP